MTWKYFGKAIVFGAVLSTAWMGAPARAQSPPTDLTELNLEEILALHIIRRSTEVEEPNRWSVGYRYINVKFDEYRDGTNDVSIAAVQWDGDLANRNDKNFPVVPETIYQQAHLVDITFNATRRWSFSLLLP